MAQDEDLTRVEVAGLAAFLAEHPPFDALGPEALDAIARGARVERFDDGAVVLDAFRNPTVEVFVVLAGRVSLWTDTDHITARYDAGVLTLRIPIAEKAKPRKITIEGGDTTHKEINA